MIVVIPRVSNLRRTNLVARRGWQRLACSRPRHPGLIGALQPLLVTLAVARPGACKAPPCGCGAAQRNRLALAIRATARQGYRSVRSGCIIFGPAATKNTVAHSSLWPNDFLEGKLFNPPDRATGNWRKQARKEPTMSVSGPPPRLWRYGSWLCEGRVRKESELRWYCLLASA
jgi:hypothetical protein